MNKSTIFWAAFSLVIVGAVFFAAGLDAAGHAAMWPGIMLFLGLGIGWLTDRL